MCLVNYYHGSTYHIWIFSSYSPHFKGRRVIEVENNATNSCYIIGLDNRTNKTRCVIGNNSCMGPLSSDSTYYVFLVSAVLFVWWCVTSIVTVCVTGCVVCMVVCNHYCHCVCHCVCCLYGGV